MSDGIVLPTRRGFKDLTGSVFERLTVISYAGPRQFGKSHKASAWNCNCQCGTQRVVFANSLLTGNTTSCGCAQRDAARLAQTKHGLSSSDEYVIWGAMKARCADSDKENYGARGIEVCERWQAFENFYADMGPRPSKKHSIERINNDGNYCPENCKWATWSEQMRNTRANRILEFRGERKTVAEWSEITGLFGSAILRRLQLGWSIEKTLMTPSKRETMSEQYVSNDEARELQDILRTLTPSGTALKTSARELVKAWEKRGVAAEEANQRRQETVAMCEQLQKELEEAKKASVSPNG